ncbi:hypothetical protein [Bradyrhizobium guangxiense]|uniref:hypothetical protein n=1 Tax=Bradyrhizobium guangxiense TaxID=1325115 RepID=UPI001ABFCD84|nr:hypothetical protein [Bradyrhizobium guangxiense]
MFHKASLTSSARDNMKRQELGQAERPLVSEVVKTVESQASDDLLRKDIGIRDVNTVWLAGLRKKIPGHDIWMSNSLSVTARSGAASDLVIGTRLSVAR